MDRVKAVLPVKVESHHAGRSPEKELTASEWTEAEDGVLERVFPTGTASGVLLCTVVLTDLVDSTGLVDKLGDEAALELFGAHDQLARRLVSRFGGQEIDKSDGFLLLFGRPRDAVEWAIAYHDGLVRLADERGVRIRARIGIHLGEVFLRQNSPDQVVRGAKPVEVEGIAKVIAARVMSLALGGQTLITQAAFDLAHRALAQAPSATELSWVSHGVYALKGVDKTLGIFEVGRPSVAPLRPPPDVTKVRRVGRRNLAVAATLGAVLLLAALLGLVLVPTGSGARPTVAVLGFDDLSEGSARAAWLGPALSELIATELAAAGELRLIPSARVARMRLELDLDGSGSFDPPTLEAIRRNLSSDYLVSGSYLVLGDAAPRRLSIQPAIQATRGDTFHRFAVNGNEADLLELVARAGAEFRDFLGLRDMTREETAAVAATLSSDRDAAREYFEGLAKLDRFDFVGAREPLERAIAADPSYALAHLALSRAWDELGYDSRARDSAARAFELREGLTRDHQLRIEARHHRMAGRWDDAVRVYRTLWELYPDELDYGLRLADVQNNGRSREALATVEALHQLPSPSGDDPRIDLLEAQVAYSLSDFRRQLAAAERASRSAGETGATLLAAEALSEQGTALSHLGVDDRVEGVFEESRRLYESVGFPRGVADTLNDHANYLENQGQTSRARDLYHETLEIDRRTGNRSGSATTLLNLAELLRKQGSLGEAERLLLDSLATVREIGDRKREAWRFMDLGWVALGLGRLSEAESWMRRARDRSEEIGYRLVQAESYLGLGVSLFAGGELEEAWQLYEQALALNEEIDDAVLSQEIRIAMARHRLAGGDLDAAAMQLAEAEALGGNPFPLLLARAELTRRRGRADDAAILARESLRGARSREQRDDVLLATATLLELALEDEDLATASVLRDELDAAVSGSESPAARLRGTLATARFEAASDRREDALELLRGARDEARRLGYALLADKADAALRALSEGPRSAP